MNSVFKMGTYLLKENGVVENKTLTESFLRILKKEKCRETDKLAREYMQW